MKHTLGSYGSYIWGAEISEIGSKNNIRFGVQVDLNLWYDTFPIIYLSYFVYANQWDNGEIKEGTLKFFNGRRELGFKNIGKIGK